ncbi:MAG: patatin-like phospholipase family protein [Clostridia bacterium]|nr:patatin-like phospholipase family protein [Clostridia bacterium]
MKTALVLSGGGSRGAYEIGVCKALRELDIHIDMVFGTSVGAINAAIVAQGTLDRAEELWLDLSTEKLFDLDHDRDDELVLPGRLQAWSERIRDKMENFDIIGMPADEAAAYLHEIIKNHGASSTGLKNMIDRYIDEGSVRSSGVEFGLTVMRVPGREGRYMFLKDIPEGQLNDFIMASASCYPAVHPYTIDGARYIDGGYHDNMPVRMATELGAERIIAVSLDSIGIIRDEDVAKAKAACREYRYIRPAFDIGNLFAFERDTIAKIMQVGYLDTLRVFGRYDGKKYTFEKGAFSESEIESADSIAMAMKMDPCKVYDRQAFLDEILEIYPQRRSRERFM